MCCCCGGRVFMLCTCLVLAVVLVGLLFGFGVYKDAFHKIHDAVRYEPGGFGVSGRRSYGFPPSTPGRF